MSIWKKAVSIGLSASLLASILATVVAPAAFAATITSIAFTNTGATVGTSPATGTFATFTPPTALAGGTTITLTMPAGTGLTGLVTTDFTVTQAGGGAATAPTNISTSGTAVTLTLAALSVGTTGSAVTVALAANPTKVVFPTTATTTGVFSVSTGAGDSGSISNVTFVAGTATHYVVTAATLTPTVSTTDLITARKADAYGNTVLTASNTITWVLGGFGSLSGAAASLTAGVGTATLTAGAVAGQTSTITVFDAAALTGNVTVTAAAVVVPPVVPPSPAGTVTLSGTKTIVRGGPAVDPVYTFTESSALSWAGGQFVTVCFTDKNGGNTLTLSGGTLAGPDSLGFGSSSYSVSGNCFTVTLGSSDTTRLEAFTVSDLKFKASSAAVPGAIQATYTTNFGGNAAYFGGTSRTASGTLAAATTAGATTLLVNLGVSSGLFVNTGSGNGNYLLNTGSSNAESLTGTASGLTGPGLGQQTLTTSAQGSNHAVGEPITQSVLGLIGTIPSPGTIVDSLTLAANSSPQVLVGVANQTAGTVTLAERPNSTGLLAVGTVITLKIQEPGVLFSALPTFAYGGGCSLALGGGTLSLDRTSATFTVTAADTSGSCLASVTFSMKYDVASTAKTGDAVNLAVTAGSIAIITSPVINAYIGSMIFVTSTAPTVYINENDQAMGKAVISEVAAGSISSGAGANTLYACLNTGESWTRAPWLVRTAGDILITNPDLLAGATKARGTQVTVGNNPNCYAWAVYTASTVASTLEIQGVDASGNPTPTARISVPNGLTPGPVYLSIGTMASLTATSGNLLDIATVAVRAFRTGITVTADTQPYIAPGTVSGPAGNLTIAQTGANLLVAGELITCTILPRTNQPSIQDTFLASANQNLLPVVSTDGVTSGLQAHLRSHTSTGFTIFVDQGATVTPGGKIFVKNINYTTTADAILGPVLVECMNSGFLPPTEGATFSGAAFDQFVSNAIIGTAPVAKPVVIDNDSAVGQVQSGFTIVTKVVKAGSWVTIRFQTTPALAGKPLGVWIAKKNANGTWGAFSPHATVTANGAGVAYYFYRTSSKVWLSFQAKYAGDATFAASQSSGTQVRWN